MTILHSGVAGHVDRTGHGWSRVRAGYDSHPTR